ncbi:MAG: hypothetical protein BMS9Abin26_2100 [Gammaproteobacteria bacterium]|nr:MAG: hypothetical protein BMS9Abin26_2100 [Gammaproteobacteria bacterium]
MAKQSNLTTHKKQQALTLLRTGDLAAAKKILLGILKRDKKDAEVWLLLASIFESEDDLKKCEYHARNAIKISPRFSEAHFLLANCYKAQKNHSRAIEHYDRLLKLQPDHLGGLIEAAISYIEMADYQNSIKYLEQALLLQPDSPVIHYNLAKACYLSGDDQQAIDHYLEAERLDPDNNLARNNLGRIYLCKGQFEKGWQYYKYRNTPDIVNSPVELPNDLQNRNILLAKSQGLGDEIFFLRGARYLKQQGARVTYLADEKIASLIERNVDVDEVITDSTDLAGYDISISVADLPLLLGMNNISELPAPIVLEPQAGRLNDIRDILQDQGKPPYIGLTWRAGTVEVNRLFKEFPLELITDTLNRLGGTVVILQRFPEDDELAWLSERLEQPVIDLNHYNEDLEDMLALLSLLDRYVGVSNTNMHLLASLNKIGHVLVPFPPDWRWMDKGDRSPWFAGFPVFRQTREGDWSEALTLLGRQLEDPLEKELL